MTKDDLTIEFLPYSFSIAKVKDYSEITVVGDFCFIQKTDEENSLVCKTSELPKNTLCSEQGYFALRIKEILDFSLIGILSRLSAIFAENGIGIFVVSTYNTDYILIKEEYKGLAKELLIAKGYSVL